MFRLLPRIPLPHILRPGPERIDEGFLEQALDLGMGARIRTLAAKAGMGAGLTDRLAAAYVAADATARVEVSRPDQVPGLRRLILMGPAYHRQTSSITLPFGGGPAERTDDTRSPLTLIGVTGDGLLFRRGLLTGEGAPSAKEGLRLVRHAPDRLLTGIGAADPGLNRYNGGASVQVRDATENVLRLTSIVLTSEERSALPYRFIQGIEHVTRTRIARRVALARYALNDAFDPDLLRLMRGCALQSLAEAAWVCGACVPEVGHPGPGRWFGAPLADLNDRDLSRTRVQAVRAYPALAKVLSQDRTLRRAIDERAPLAPAIARHLRVEESGVRLLNGLTWQMAGVQPTSPANGLARLTTVPRDLAPTRRAEHRQLALISSFSTLLGETFGETMRRFARGGSPYRFGAELGRTAPHDVRDAAEYLVDKLLLPARLHALRAICEADGSARPTGADQRTRTLMIRDLLRSVPVRSLFELSERWHRNLERHEDRIVTFRSRVSWPPLIGTLDLGGGVTVRELASADALQRQGRREGHCVGGYTDKVLRSGTGRLTLIASIERDGAVLGTAELELRRAKPGGRSGPEAPPWEAGVVQNRSRENGPVCEAADLAAARACRALEGLDPELISEHLSGLGRVRYEQSRHGALPEHLRRAGYDIWDRTRLEAAWEELSMHLPRPARRAGLDGLIADQGRALTTKGACPPELMRGSGSRFWQRDALSVANLLDPAQPGPEREPRGSSVDEEDPDCLPF